jgi:hypothetical protein
MKKRIQGWLCFVFGHRYIVVTSYDNGRSIMADMLCQRCEHYHSWQYDK